MLKRNLNDRIQERLRKLRKSERAASLEAGLSDAFIRNIRKNRSNSPRSDTIAKLAPVLGTTEAWLLREEGPEDLTDAPSVDESPRMVVRDDVPSVPVLGTAAGSHVGGAFQFTGDTIDYVTPPPALVGMKDLFALYVEGDSMMPEHRPGDLRFATPNRPARPGDTVIVEAAEDPSEPERKWAMIAHLIHRHGRHAKVAKLNPEQVIEIPFVTRIHRVLTQSELFGR